jgi:L,D-transpeptidase YcbB
MTLLVGLSGTLWACGEATIEEEQAASYVDDWAPSVEDTLRKMAVGPAGKKHFVERIERAAAADEAKNQRDEPPYDVFVKEAYAELDNEFQLVDRSGLTERGQAVWEALSSVEEHALDPADYPIEDIESTLEELAAANDRFEKLGSFETSQAQIDVAKSWLVEQPVSDFELDEDNFEALTRQVLDSSSGERMKERLADYETVSEEIGALEAELEQKLARNTLRYARQLRHFRIKDIFIHPRHDDRWNNPYIEGRRPDRDKGPYKAGIVWRRAAAVAEEMSDEVAILHDRLRQTLREVLTADAGATLAALAPQQPQYAGLKAELARYKAIAKEGGWREVERKSRLRPGSSHEVVADLKKRLQIEGYYPADAPVDEDFGETLEEAITAYQQTHQMKVTGKPHHSFWSSLNIPASRRVEQIELNMQRWRQSNVDHSDPIYVLINIADYHTEIWKDQERAHRIRIVVGKNNSAVDEETDEKIFPNRTPKVSAYIDRLIYNPYWNVTDRIRAEEILPEVRTSVEASYKARIGRLLGVPDKSDEADEASAEEADDDQGTFTDSIAAAAFGGSDDDDGADSDDDSETSSGVGAPRSGPSPESYWHKNGDGELVFDVARIRKLVSSGGSGSEAAADADAAAGAEPAGEAGESKPSALASKFPYLDTETGLVDISSTIPERVPAWYEANNYEVMYPGKKWEYVRMTQGAHNALGKVKIIFPNMHDVYLHDTPQKALFNQEIRAFSHGCMRVHEPLTFAQYLLEHDGQLDDYNLDHILAEEIYEPIFLKRRVPVHVDYFTVRVNEDGRANFLADIYRYDSFDDG